MPNMLRDEFVSRILESIWKEVARAKNQWGEKFDRANTLNDWVAYTNIYLGQAVRMGATVEEQETNLRKAAGLLISAIDMLKREGFSPRHYEGLDRPKSLPEINA